MCEFWTFIGGVAVGILAVIGVFAMEEEDKPFFVECDEDGLEEVEDETDDDERLIVRTV